MRISTTCLAIVLLSAAVRRSCPRTPQGIGTAAASQNPDRNPIIVIPGILGSRGRWQQAGRVRAKFGWRGEPRQRKAAG
jgi:hypothetical protein